MVDRILDDGGAAAGAPTPKHPQPVHGADDGRPGVAAAHLVQRVFDEIQDRRAKDQALCIALRDELERLGLDDLTQARNLCELLFDRLGDIADLQYYRGALST